MNVCNGAIRSFECMCIFICIVIVSSVEIDPLYAFDSIENILNGRLYPIEELNKNLDLISGSCLELHHELHSLQNANEDIPDLDNKIQYCNKIKYLQYTTDRYDILLQKVKRKSTQQAGERHTIAIENSDDRVNTNDIVDFEGFFVRYMEQQIPVVLSGNMSFRENHTSIRDFLGACFIAEENGISSPIKMSLNSKCLDLLSYLYAPLFLVNDYLNRINVPEWVDKPSPTLYAIPRTSSTVNWCPYDLHSGIVAVSGSVEVLLYNKNDSYAMFPLSKSGPESIFNNNSIPHIDEYCSKDFNPWKTSTAENEYPFLSSITSYKATLNEGHTLFIPANLVASMTSSPGNNLAGSKVLRYCFTDASNLNTFKKHLRIDSLVNNVTKKLFHTIQDQNNSWFMYHRFPISAQLYLDAIKWPKVLPKEVVGRKQRYKYWQKQRRWNNFIEILTLPHSHPPYIVSSTRNSVEISWQDIYHPKKDDITSYGYEVTYHMFTYVNGSKLETTQSKTRVPFSELTKSTLPSTRFGEEFDGNELVYSVTDLHPNTSYAFSTRVYVGNDALGVDSDLSSVIRTKPIVPPSVVHGIPIITHVECSCMSLKWNSPVDNGGSPVSSYLISRRLVESAMHGELLMIQESVENKTIGFYDVVKHSAELTEGKICNLFPGNMYQFRIAAANAVGIGKWSVKTYPVITNSCKDPKPETVITGIGHLNFQSVVEVTLTPVGEHEQFSLISTKTERSYPVGTLSDRHHQIRVYPSDHLSYLLPMNAFLTSPVWVGHFSPRTFNVTSEIILGNPLDGGGKLQNSNLVRNRIVLLSRGGGISFHTKAENAQNAGALGVLIFDKGNKCKNRFDQLCVPGGDKERGEGFGGLDNPKLWKQIKIPTVLLLEKDGLALKEIIEGKVNRKPIV